MPSAEPGREEEVDFVGAGSGWLGSNPIDLLLGMKDDRGDPLLKKPAREDLGLGGKSFSLSKATGARARGALA